MQYNTLQSTSDEPTIKFFIDAKRLFGALADDSDVVEPFSPASIVIFNNSAGWELYRDNTVVSVSTQQKGINTHSSIKRISLSAFADLRSYFLEENFLDPTANPYFCIHDYGCTIVPLPVNNATELLVFVNELSNDGKYHGYQLVPNVDYTLHSDNSGNYIQLIRHV